MFPQSCIVKTIIFHHVSWWNPHFHHDFSLEPTPDAPWIPRDAPNLRRPQDTNGRHRAAQGDGALGWLDPGFPGFMSGISVGLIMVNPSTTGVNWPTHTI